MTDDLLKLPADLADSYEVVSCLKYAEDNAVYRICRKKDGMPYILKTASGPFYAGLLTNEENILNFIHAFEDSWHSQMFPTVVSLSRDEATDTVYYIRSYIEGKTLEELCETNLSMPGIPLRQALDYLIALTDQLRFLHAMNPPLIHRDIKPQNIVVDPEGGCHFIDLGIARFFQPEKRGDTLIMGTQLTAPPEQFGYQQCDTRSDLYSLGILFYYCLTGEYQVNDNLLSTLDASAASVIRRATMFDPANRYQNADDMLADLLAIRYPQVADFCSSRVLNPHADASGFVLPGRNADTSTDGKSSKGGSDDSRSDHISIFFCFRTRQKDSGPFFLAFSDCFDRINRTDYDRCNFRNSAFQPDRSSFDCKFRDQRKRLL
ncbi:MAG: protein kinase [Lachnospiraceae bacterium]|nr:protein kinase [Lachnospiraceae bacterium]